MPFSQYFLLQKMSSLDHVPEELSLNSGLSQEPEKEDIILSEDTVFKIWFCFCFYSLLFIFILFYFLHCFPWLVSQRVTLLKARIVLVVSIFSS